MSRCRHGHAMFPPNSPRYSTITWSASVTLTLPGCWLQLLGKQKRCERKKKRYISYYVSLEIRLVTKSWCTLCHGKTDILSLFKLNVQWLIYCILSLEWDCPNKWPLINSKKYIKNRQPNSLCSKSKHCHDKKFSTVIQINFTINWYKLSNILRCFNYSKIVIL